MRDLVNINNKLVEIGENEWKSLRDLYMKNWPQNCVGYYTVDNYIRWFESDKNIKNIKFFSLNGDWQSDGTFLIVDRYQLFVNTLNPTNDRIQIALSLLNWSNGFKVSTLLLRHRPPIDHILESRKLTKEFDCFTILYFMPRNEGCALEINIPQGITLKPLNKDKHASKVNNAWPNAHNGSLFLIKRFIELNVNLGAFTDDGELVAWSLRFQAGPLGAFQVDEKHTRKGYGLLVLKAITKQLSLMNIDTYASVAVDNVASIGMFEKAGFKAVDHCYWLRTNPEDDFQWTDETLEIY